VCVCVCVCVIAAFVNVFIDGCSSSDNVAPVVRKLQSDDGRMLNVNEAK